MKPIKQYANILPHPQVLITWLDNAIVAKPSHRPWPEHYLIHHQTQNSYNLGRLPGELSMICQRIVNRCATSMDWYSIFHFSLDWLLIAQERARMHIPMVPYTQKMHSMHSKVNLLDMGPSQWINHSPCHDPWTHLWEKLKKRKWP